MIKLTIELDKTVSYIEYDIDSRTDLEELKKYEIEAGEGYDPDSAECYDKTLEEWKEYCTDMDLDTYFMDYKYVETVNGNDYYIAESSGGFNLYESIDQSKVFLAPDEVIRDLLGD